MPRFGGGKGDVWGGISFQFECQAWVFTPAPWSWVIIFATLRTASDGIVRRTSPVSLSTIETTSRCASSSISKRTPVDQALRLLLMDSSAFSKEDWGGLDRLSQAEFSRIRLLAEAACLRVVRRRDLGGGRGLGLCAFRYGSRQTQA